MIIKINNPKKDGKAYKNNGSCIDLVNYLGKEDLNQGEKKEHFFSHTDDYVSELTVVNSIDSLRSGLGKDEAKFYSLIIAPEDEKELQLMKNPKLELKEFTRETMEIYAKNFNGLSVKKKLTADDLVYFGKIEYLRHYKGNDKEVLEKKAKAGDLKPGNNIHVHIIVARKDKANKLKLSPVVNNKKLFHIEGFKLKAGYAFNKKYEIDTAVNDLERVMINRKGDRSEVDLYKDHKPQNISKSSTEQKPNITKESPNDDRKNRRPRQ